MPSRTFTPSQDYRKPSLADGFRAIRGKAGGHMHWSWYEPRNFGDWVGPFLYEGMTGERPFYVGRTAQRLGLHKRLAPCLFTAGSILRRIQRPDFATVWGSGIISRNDSFAQPKDVLAVRGPRSHERLKQLGYPETETYGDPAILLSRYYQPTSSPVAGRIGFIPHYFDLEALRSQVKDDVFLIDVTRSVADVIEDIASCELVFSSSLHWVIVTHAFGVPAIWCHSERELIGRRYRVSGLFRKRRYLWHRAPDHRDRTAFRCPARPIRQTPDPARPAGSSGRPHGGLSHQSQTPPNTAGRGTGR